MKSERSQPPSALRLASILAIGVTTLAVALLALRLRYGFDAIDESYYAAGSYRFALGLRPILDDLGPHQFASYLTSPLVWAWLSLRGNLDGIILALRVTYFVASLIAATVAFTLLRKLLDWRIALVSVTCALGLVPLLIFAPSYNTIAILSISLGCSLAGISLIDRDRPQLFLLSGMALTLAAIAYPTLAVVVVVAIPLLGWQSRSWKASALMAAGVVLAAMVFLVTIRGTLVGASDFAMYNRFLSDQVGWLTGLKKLAILARGIVGETYLAPAAWLMAVIVGYRLARRRVPIALTVLLPISTLLVFHVGGPAGRTMVTSTFLLMSVAVSGMTCISAEQRKALYFVFGVGTCAAAIIAYTSAGGFFSFGYGATAVAAPALAVLLGNAQQALAKRTSRTRGTLWAVVIGVLMACGVVALCWETVYPWGPAPLQLHANGAGPYAGLLGTAELASASSQMRSDLERAAAGPRDRLLVYGATPSAYILSPARPVAPFLWMGGVEGTSRPHAEFVVQWIETATHRPTLVLVDAGLWNGRASEPHDYLLDYIGRDFTPVLSRPGYVILRAR